MQHSNQQALKNYKNNKHRNDKYIYIFKEQFQIEIIIIIKKVSFHAQYTLQYT